MAFKGAAHHVVGSLPKARKEATLYNGEANLYFIYKKRVVLSNVHYKDENIGQPACFLIFLFFGNNR